MLVHSYRTAPGDHPSAQNDALGLLSDAEKAWSALVQRTAHLKQQIPLFGMPGKPACRRAVCIVCMVTVCLCARVCVCPCRWWAGGNFSWSALTPMVQRDASFARIPFSCYAALHALCDDKQGAHAGKGCSGCVGQEHGPELKAAKCSAADTELWCDGVA